MNKSRANEIASQPEMINVTYNGEPVYIETVNPNKDTASVHYLNRPEYSKEVHVTQLVESE
jgi:small acid-soluble spore protein H (minor)